MHSAQVVGSGISTPTDTAKSPEIAGYLKQMAEILHEAKLSASTANAEAARAAAASQSVASVLDKARPEMEDAVNRAEAASFSAQGNATTVDQVSRRLTSTATEATASLERAYQGHAQALAATIAAASAPSPRQGGMASRR